MKGNVFGYSCPGCGTGEQVRDSWQIIARCTCFSGTVRSFAGPSDWVPLWGNVLPLPRLSVGSRPWPVAQTGGGVRVWTRSSPDVQVIFPW